MASIRKRRDNFQKRSINVPKEKNLRQLRSPAIVIWKRDLATNKETKSKVNYNTTSDGENDAENHKTRQTEKHVDKLKMCSAKQPNRSGDGQDMWCGNETDVGRKR